MNYFSSLPLKQYDIEKNKKYRTVSDLGRRVGIRSDISDIIPAYYKASISSSERPEVLAYELYNNSEYHWVLLQLNNVVDPYYDWILEDYTFDDFLKKKYPNMGLLLESDHFGANSYNNSDPKKHFFYPGEIVKAEVGSGDGDQSGAEGTVIEFNPTIRQLIYTHVSGTFINGEVITGQNSSAISKIESYISEEMNAIHHYESIAPTETGLVVGRAYEVTYGTTSYASTPITNQLYELNRNEEQREISVLNSNYVQQYINEFKEKVSQ